MKVLQVHHMLHLGLRLCQQMSRRGAHKGDKLSVRIEIGCITFTLRPQARELPYSETARAHSLS